MRACQEIQLIKLVGAPGSGKGAICKKLLEDYGFYHLSVGDMIRQLSNETDCRDRATIQENLQHGDLLPTWLIIPLLTVKIDEEMEMGQHQHYLVDGFPRELSQAKEAMKEVQDHDTLPSIKVFIADNFIDPNSHPRYLFQLP